MIDVSLPQSFELHVPVFLLSAGPGDPSLVPVKTMYILSQVDVVLYDYLAHPSLLSVCKSGVQLICVGKRKGSHSVQQSQIHEYIEAFVREGRTVARLKGGDSVTFSRGGEEIDFLRQLGIAYDVVPGISSFNGILGHLGVPLTHREFSRSVSLLSASPKAGADDETILIPATDTLVFFMVLSHLHSLLDRILDEHPFFTEDTPVLVVSSGTFSYERLFSGTLGTLQPTLLAESIQSPVLLIVGETVSRYPTHSCIHHRPLYGRRIWLFRHQADSLDYVQSLSALGAEVMVAPLLDFKYVFRNSPSVSYQFEMANTLIFTSQNGVRYFFKWLFANGFDCRDLNGKRICAIGPHTHRLLSEFGLVPDFTPTLASSEGFTQEFPFNWTDVYAIFPESTKARGFISDVIQSKGGQCVSWPMYESVQVEPITNELREQDILYLTSPSIVHAFMAQFRHESTALHYVVSGQFTADALIEYGVDSPINLAVPSPHHLISSLTSQFQ